MRGLLWVAFAFFALYPVTSNAQDITTGLISHHKLDETSGTSAADSAGSYTGTWSGEANIRSASGRLVTAFDFDGDDDAVSLGNLGFDFSTDYTLSLWFKAHRYGDPASGCGNLRAGIFNKRGSPTHYEDIQINLSGGGGISTYQIGQSGTNYSSNSGVLNLNEWYHLILKYDTTENEQTLYINGTQIHTSDTSADPLKSVGAEARLGDHFNNCGESEFDGLIDEFRLYNRALTDTDITALYNVKDYTTGLVAHYEFEETTGTNLTDSAGANDGIFSGAANVTSTEGRVENALDFDGDDDAITLGTMGAIDFTGDYTISTWIYPHRYGDPNTACGDKRAGIFAKGGAVLSEELKLVLAGDPSVVPRALYFNHFGAGASLLYSIPNLDTWYHVTITRESDAEMIRMYINGTEVDSLDISGQSPGVISGSASIGDVLYNCDHGEFDGLIDDLRIYERALTATDVLGLYTAEGGVGTCSSAYAGVIIYNSEQNVLQYCNSTDWINMGPRKAAGSGSCSNPDGVAGEMDFNSDKTVLQYCNGNDWISIGGRSAGTPSPEIANNGTAIITDATRFSYPTGIDISDNYAYVASANNNALSIVDISDPKNPSVTATLVDGSDMNGAFGVAVKDNYAYVISINSASLAVIDISNPAAPVIAGGGTAVLTDATNLDGARDIKIVGNYAYIASRASDSLMIVDISNPLAPTMTGLLVDNTNLNGAIKLEVIGNYAYITCFDGNRFAIVDISNPAAPAIAGGGTGVLHDATNLNRVRGIKVVGSNAYVVGQTANNFVTIDVSNPAAPVIAGGGTAILTDATNLVQAIDLDIAGNYAYVAGDENITVIDISTPTTPVIADAGTAVLNDGTNLASAAKIYIRDNYAYVGSLDSNSFSVIDLSTKGGSASGTCSSPDGVPGELVYNSDQNIMQYCNGVNWIGIGKIEY